MSNNIEETDLVVIGGGPAGLCAAINGASEGLSVRLLDDAMRLGGQAIESSAIENYPGFPDGVTGDTLMGCMARQAAKFETIFSCPSTVANIHRDEINNKIICTTDDYREFTSRTVLITIGLSYRRLQAQGMGTLLGRGVYYGAPSIHLNSGKKRTVAVIGGANSAGQAVVKLASNPHTTVYIIIRKTIDALMSKYLIDRIKKCPNVYILEHSEVTSVEGTHELEKIVVKNKDETTRCLLMDCLFIYIGAAPRTLWLKGTLELDSDKYIKTWKDTSREDALPYETSLKGVFAAGDVRSGSTKRIATSAGEGAGALQMIHKYLNSN